MAGFARAMVVFSDRHRSQYLEPLLKENALVLMDHINVYCSFLSFNFQMWFDNAVPASFLFRMFDL